MTSLRLRLFTMLVAMTFLVWAGAAAWTAFSTKAEVERVLDRRLSEAARMVASLGVTSQAVRGSGALAAIGRYDRQLSCQIWSLDGRVVGRSASAPTRPLVPIADGATGFSQQRVEGEVWRVYTLVDRANGAQVMVGDNLKMRQHLVTDLMTGLVLPAIAGLIALSLLLWATIGRGLAPLRAIARSLEGRSPEDLAPLSPIDIPTELRPVITALDGLFVRLADARDAERSFVANAAHELRTPLAGLVTHADIARRSEDPAVRQRALTRITESADRMNRLVQQLLLLARQEAHGAEVGTSDVSVVVARVTADLNAAAHARGIELRTAGLNQQVSMPIGDERLSIAVRNLVENAVRHGPANSPVLIQWCSKRRELTIEDRGAGIAAVELERVRRRFERGTGTTASGSGLGLSIVDAALKGTSLQLHMEQRAGGGFRASIIDQPKKQAS